VQEQVGDRRLQRDGATGIVIDLAAVAYMNSTALGVILAAQNRLRGAGGWLYAARTSADQRVATAEAGLAEEIQRRRAAEAERDTAYSDREQADAAAAQAVARMEELERELAALRTAIDTEIRSVPATAARTSR
jgi:anti-anti-sigma factor